METAIMNPSTYEAEAQTKKSENRKRLLRLQLNGSVLCLSSKQQAADLKSEYWVGWGGGCYLYL